MRPRLRRQHRAPDEDRGRPFQLVRLRRHERDPRVPPLPLILVDGNPSDFVPAADRGLAFGDGIFRTIAVRGGRPLNWGWHWQRLLADCATLALPAPDQDTLFDEVTRVAPGDAVAKVTITRGDATRGYAIPREARARRIVASFPAPSHPAANATQGVRVRRCALVLSEQPRLAGAKTLNRLENVLARSEWDDEAIAEGLLGDAHGHVIEGTMSNLFVAKDSDVFTPSLARCGVVGAQRERVRELLERQGMHCREAELRWGDLDRFDEVFLTNSLIGVWPVRELDGETWPVGPVARHLLQAIAAADARA